METVDAQAGSLLAGMLDSWNRGDAAGWSAPFATDADFITINGLHVKSRTGIEDGHRRLFATIYRGSHMQGEVEDVRVLRPDVAVVWAHGQLRYGANGQPQQEREWRWTLVLLRSDSNSWQIAAFQNTEVADPSRVPASAQAGV